MRAKANRISDKNSKESLRESFLSPLPKSRSARVVMYSVKTVFMSLNIRILLTLENCKYIEESMKMS
jgi:hypothetical protein|tara:strand:- start:1430 stop:1630 length:201 start_codon:yes stop_codon:yes gene_type:complete